jgi:hypothetical protein
LILNLRPSIGPSTGLILTGPLGMITIGILAPWHLGAWRGPWSARAPSFPGRMAALSLTTVLANYHSQVHGLTLFALPLAAAYGSPQVSQQTRYALLPRALAPGLIVVGLDHFVLREVIRDQPTDVLIWSRLVQVLLTLATGSLIADVLRRRSSLAVPRESTEAGRLAPEVSGG